MRSKKDGSNVVPPTSSSPLPPETAPDAAPDVPPDEALSLQAAGTPPQDPPQDPPGGGEAPPNAFDAGFLGRLEEQEEREEAPPTAAEAELAGPWRIEPLPKAVGGGYGLFRAGESVARGFRPQARFVSLWSAKLVAALLPGLARDAAYRLRSDAEAPGFALESREAWGAVIGFVEVFDPSLVDALNVADGLMRSPWALSLFLEVCGKTALEKAGAILVARLARIS
jgi:hypothetical protein